MKVDHCGHASLTLRSRFFCVRLVLGLVGDVMKFNQAMGTWDDDDSIEARYHNTPRHQLSTYPASDAAQMQTSSEQNAHGASPF